MDCSFGGSSTNVHNAADSYAIALKKHSGAIVGNLPRNILGLLHMFIDQGGDIDTCLYIKVETLLCDTRSSHDN